MLHANDLWIDTTVSKKALQNFVSRIQINPYPRFHAMEVLYHGRIVARLAPAPYSVNTKTEIYSLSKSFCSTAIGFLVTDGVLSVEDKIAELFPDKMPDSPCEHLKQLRLKHVLSMNTGHARCVMDLMHSSEDPVRTFLAEDFPYEPGTHFIYNTGATCLLSCLVEKITGMTLLDFLTARLFVPLGISAVQWNAIDAGQNEGGCGIHLSVEDIAKLGQLYLNHGVWKEKRLLSEAWIEDAVSYHSDNSQNGTPDWCAGYGFQFWLNAKEGYRGDGAYGQLCVVLPKHDMVFAVQGETSDMQTEVSAIFELAEHLFDSDETQAMILPAFRPPVSPYPAPDAFFGRFFRMEKNLQGWTGLYFVREEETDTIDAFFSDGVRQYTLRAGNGQLEESAVTAPFFKPKLRNLMSFPIETSRMASFYESDQNDLFFTMLFLNCPHVLKIRFRSDGSTLHMEYEHTGLLPDDVQHMVGHTL